jgi:hypothetical protein
MIQPLTAMVTHQLVFSRWVQHPTHTVFSPDQTPDRVLLVVTFALMVTPMDPQLSA